MESIIKRLMENHRVTESRSIDIKQLETEVRDKVKDVMTSSNFGFDDTEYNEYSTVEIYDKDNHYEVEVRAEVDYDGMEELANALNPIVAKYDEDAYFDMVTSGIMSAYIMK